MSAADRQHLLLLTATVVPKQGQPDLALRDPAARLHDYVQALQHYQRLLQQGVVRGVVFVENSGFDLAVLARQFPHPAIEWIALPPMAYPATCHRGYGEFCMIDHVMQHARLVLAASNDTLVWKVTGRYRVANLARLLAWAPARATLYGAWSMRWCELSVLAWTRAGYRRALQARVPLLASAEAPERILAAQFTAMRRAEPGLVARFVWPPWLDGHRATSGRPYRGRLGVLRHVAGILSGLCSWRPASRAPHPALRGW